MLTEILYKLLISKKAQKKLMQMRLLNLLNKAIKLLKHYSRVFFRNWEIILLIIFALFCLANAAAI